MPDPQKILNTVRHATELFHTTPGRRGGVVYLDGSAADVMVVGDLHGHIHTFASALKLAALGDNPARHLVLQELVHDPRIRPDDGDVDPSHRLVDLVCALKCQYPDRVHLILGNHELSELTGRSIAKNGFALNALFLKGIETTYGDAAEAVHDAYLRLFAALPIAVRTPNRVMICHTIPDGPRLDELDLTVLEVDEWPEESLRRGGTIYALTWGRDTSPETLDRFAAMVDSDLFVTGHQPCDEGFRQANPRQLILDATDPKPMCCLFHANGPVAIESLLDGVRPVPMRI